MRLLTPRTLGQPDHGVLGPPSSDPGARPPGGQRAVRGRRGRAAQPAAPGGWADKRWLGAGQWPRSLQSSGCPAAGHPGVQLGTRLERRHVLRVPHCGRAHRGHGPRRPVSWPGARGLWRGGGGVGGCRPVPVLCSSALREERLLLTQTGSSSPCLDLRYPEAPPCPSLASLRATEGSSPSVGPAGCTVGRVGPIW